MWVHVSAMCVCGLSMVDVCKVCMQLQKIMLVQDVQQRSGTARRDKRKTLYIFINFSVAGFSFISF